MIQEVDYKGIHRRKGYPCHFTDRIKKITDSIVVRNQSLHWLRRSSLIADNYPCQRVFHYRIFEYVLDNNHGDCDKWACFDYYGALCGVRQDGRGG